MNLPKRKPARLKDYDYSSEGAYFITICTRDKQKILCDIVGDGVYDIPKIKLSQQGEIADKHIKKMNSQYGNIRIEKYVIMPNHIHLIIKVSNETNNSNILHGSSQAPNPTNEIIPKFVSLYKRYCNRECGENVWQRSFYDHIIRNEKDYLEIWQYIEDNSRKWNEDKFYTK